MYFPTRLSLDSYRELWDYQSGLPTYLVQQLRHGVAGHPVRAGPDPPAGYALARFRPGKEVLFVFLLLALSSPTRRC